MCRDSVAPSGAEIAAARPGDELVDPADVVMDRAFTVDAAAAQVWPWLVQLGKGRAGWYLPAALERVVPRSHRAARAIDPRWQGLEVGDVIPDYGGKDGYFEVAAIDAPTSLVYRSRRGRVELIWSITLQPTPTGSTRVLLRLRLGPVRHRRLAHHLGGWFDRVTIAGMAAGMRERVADHR